MAVTLTHNGSGRRVDPASVIVSFGLFTSAAFMIGEMIAYLGFGAHAGLPGILGAIAVSTLLTVAFRDRMKVSDVASE